MDIATQISKLRSLKDGWRDGQGKAPSKAGLRWLESLLGSVLDHQDDDDSEDSGSFPEPTIYPLLSGKVRFEWDIDGHDITLDIDLKAKVGKWTDIDTSDDGYDSRSGEIDLSRDHPYRKIFGLFGQFSGDEWD